MNKVTVAEVGTASSVEGPQRFIDQAFELWINPEFERREAYDPTFDRSSIYAAQVIWPPSRQLIVRFNDEVRGNAWIKAARDVEKGEIVLLSDFDDLQGFELLDEEIDCQHVTLLRQRAGVFATFNFLTHRGQGAALLEKAEQFLAASKRALQCGHAAVVVDTMFSACELAAKADLSTSHAVTTERTGHGAIQAALNRQRQLGNVEGAFADLFNNLSNKRAPYRYAAGVSDGSPVGLDEAEIVQIYIDRVRQKISIPAPSEAMKAP